MIRFISDEIKIEAAADPTATPSRTITAVAVPFGKFAAVSDGQLVGFAPGSLPTDGNPPRVYLFHDPTKPVGIVTERVTTDNEMLVAMKISKTALGDEALTLAADGVFAVSVGVTPVDYVVDDQGRMLVTAARFDEISLVPQPAFSDAQITKVAASAEIPEINPDIVHNEETESTVTETEEIEMNESTENNETVTPTAPVSFAQPRKFNLPTPGEYVAAFVAGGAQFAALTARIQAAAPDVISTDGSLPEPVLGPVYDSFRGLRPTIDALGPRSMPQSGRVFLRPVVTTHNSISEQTNELDTLQASAFVITDQQFTKKSFGGYVNLSEQAIDWTSPEILGALLDDMGRVYANETDAYAATTVEAGATNTLNFDSTKYDDPAYWAEWVYWAAATILTNSNGNLPTALMVDPNMWQRLGRLSDTADRPLFPQVGPMNAFGQMQPGSTESVAFGMRVVVDRNLPTNTLIVGDPSGAEFYEQIKGSISIDSPSTMSRVIAWRGYAACEVIDPSKFIKAAIV